MIGGHVIKTGDSPILSNLVKQEFITYLAPNESAAIHDTEQALFGHTSEDVASQIEDGSFGMDHDTGDFVNNAARESSETQTGFGQKLEEQLIRKNPHIL